MRAIVITRPGGPEVLAEREVERPTAGDRQILVRVAATAVNRADLLQRMGRYPPPPGWPPDIPGLEYAGTIEAVGPAVVGWTAGSRVMGLAGGGAYAEYIAVHEDEAVPVPGSCSLESAAALPEAFITAHDALITQADLRAGEALLIHGVGSGVGTAAVQIGAVVGAKTFGTSRSPWKLERARALGLDRGIDPGLEDFTEVVAGETAGRGADVILDLVGGGYLGGNVRALAMRGRLLVVGLVAGATAELDMRTLMSRRATVRGTVLRSRAPAEKAEVTRRFAEFALPLLESGRLEPVIDRVLPIGQAAAAHARVEANLNFGKVVLAF